jgi:hypothetical protein
MWIAQTDKNGILIAPPAFVEPNGGPEQLAQAIGWPDGSWRVITAEKAAELQRPTPEEEQTAMQQAFTGAIQQRLDSFAQTRGYDNIFTATTYAASTSPRFGPQGRYAVEARDATWKAAYELLEEVLTGKRPMPTLEEVFAELPELRWPDEEVVF